MGKDTKFCINHVYKRRKSEEVTDFQTPKKTYLEVNKAITYIRFKIKEYYFKEKMGLFVNADNVNEFNYIFTFRFSSTPLDRQLKWIWKKERNALVCFSSDNLFFKPT
jgi:hypothetical protein